MSMDAAMDPTTVLWRWLEELRDAYRARPEDFPSGRLLESPFGQVGVLAGEDRFDDAGYELGGGAFISVGFCLPDGVYAETESGYEQLQGFRIYRDGADD